MELVLLLIATLGIFFFLIGAVFYVLKSIGLATLAANKGIDLPWLAWIPVADLYIAGAIVEEMNLFGIRFTNLALWTPLIVCGGACLAPIPVIGWLITVGVFIFGIGFTYYLFDIYTENATIFTVLSIFLALWAVFIFVIRNNKPRNMDINI
ncbi:MAG: hypothetical protein PHT62_06345 [Desulfotomaculaceae bacterium]|nr:hypothetical protein [Desulfotomaculaceae bacterium]